MQQGANNWYDVIGWSIAYSGILPINIAFSLEYVKIELANTYEHKVEDSAESFALPFYNLINHWVDKDYKARRV